MSFESSNGSPIDPAMGQCRILIVDDDSECLNEYVEMISGLGYACIGLESPTEALQLMAADSSIGIIVADVEMPAMDGLTLLDELSTRFMPTRPLVTLIITGHTSLENAVQAMRSSASDFLSKPVSFEDLAAALRRATTRWAQLLGRSKVEALSRRAESQYKAVDEFGAGEMASSTSQAELKSFVRMVVKSRQNRAQYLDSALFADPAWDILLDLTSAALEGKPVPASSVSAASQSPLSTALRYVRQLTDAGLIKSWRDPSDKRRTLLELEPEAFEAMKAYLISVRQQQHSASI